MRKTPKRTAKRSTSDAVKILDRLFIGQSVARRNAADKAYEDALIGQLIFDARTKAKLTQKQLAELIGTDQAVVSRLEDADYSGHSLTMLRRIAAALGKRVDIRFVNAA